MARASERQRERMMERRRELEERSLCVICAKRKSLKGIKHCRKCQIRRSTLARNRLQKLWQKLREIYGKVCACCEESEPAFLTIDHINNDGWRDRKPDGKNPTSSEMIYRRLVFGPRRKDIQILCYNCNCARQRVGYCPHRPQKAIPRRVRGARSRKLKWSIK